jgi:hypothetical protein
MAWYYNYLDTKWHEEETEDESDDKRIADAQQLKAESAAADAAADAGTFDGECC